MYSLSPPGYNQRHIKWCHRHNYLNMYFKQKGMTCMATVTKHIICAKTSSNGISVAGRLEASRSFVLE